MKLPSSLVPSLAALCISAVLFSVSLNAQTAEINDDLIAIRNTLNNYFEGFKHGDRERLEKAFAVPIAHMKSYIRNDQGVLIEASRPMHEVIDDWVSRDPSPDFKGKILSINIFSEVAAQAIFDFNGIYTDAFQLAKIKGEWRIINKFYVNQE